MSNWTETAIKCLRDEAEALLGLIPNICLLYTSDAADEY